MKNKHKRILQNKYKWYDRNYLLTMMRDWLSYSAHKHKTQGQLVRSNRTAKEMNICRILIDRLLSDDYNNKTAIWPDVSNEIDFVPSDDMEGYYQMVVTQYIPDEKTYNKYFIKHERYKDLCRERDKDYLFKLMSKWIDGWWD